MQAQSQHPLTRLLAKSSLRVIGLMSGTSVDGIDAALVEISGAGDALSVRVEGFETFAYTPEDAARIHGLFGAQTSAIAQGHFWLGERFAEAALLLCKKLGVSPREIDLIGSHGQTVWHEPPATLQLAEPAVISARTGIVTVADFRVADTALGGQGAPLVPFVDWLLYRREGHTRALQNIGGISNVTVVTPHKDGVFAFDNGPGNMMIDRAVEKLFADSGERFDRGGALSARGQEIPALLEALLDDEYLRAPPPKSTGRERYGAQMTDAWLEKHAAHKREDLLRTLVAFTGDAIARSYRDFVLPKNNLDEVRISGGGAHNATLMKHLQDSLAPLPVRAFSDGGVSADAKEAVAFAVLAARTLRAQTGNLPRVTGARHEAVLGKICF